MPEAACLAGYSAVGTDSDEAFWPRPEFEPCRPESALRPVLQSLSPCRKAVAASVRFSDADAWIGRLGQLWIAFDAGENGIAVALMQERTGL